MKKIFYLLTLCLAFCFTGCKESNEVSSSTIIGDWVSDRITEYYLENGQYKSEVEYEYTYLSIYANNSCTWSSGASSDYGNWVLNGNTLILSFSSGGYDDYIKCTVQKCNSKELVLRLDFDNGYADYNFKKR